MTEGVRIAHGRTLLRELCEHVLGGVEHPAVGVVELGRELGGEVPAGSERAAAVAERRGAVGVRLPDVGAPAVVREHAADGADLGGVEEGVEPELPDVGLGVVECRNVAVEVPILPVPRRHAGSGIAGNLLRCGGGQRTLQRMTTSPLSSRRKAGLPAASSFIISPCRLYAAKSNIELRSAGHSTAVRRLGNGGRDDGQRVPHR